MQTKIYYYGLRNSQTGASMPEFALSFPIIILMISFLIDAGLYLFQNALLTDATAALNRQITVALGQRDNLLNANCLDLQTAASAVRANVTSATPVLYKDMTFEMGLTSGNAANPSPYRLISLVGAVPFRCLSCKFFDLAQVGLTIGSTSVSVIERPGAGACSAITKGSF